MWHGCDVVVAVATTIDGILDARPTSKTFLIDGHSTVAIWELAARDFAIGELDIARSTVPVAIH
jgi:hypothetical protein